MAYRYYNKQTLKAENPVVTMEIADYGTVKIELYPEMAPNTVRNFIKLINEEELFIKVKKILINKKANQYKYELIDSNLAFDHGLIISNGINKTLHEKVE